MPTSTKPLSPPADSTQAKSGPTTEPTAGAETPELAAKPLSKRASIVDASPEKFATYLVEEALRIYQQVPAANVPSELRQHIKTTLDMCPLDKISAVRSEGKARAERLKQFAEMLYNEFVYQSATRGK